VRIRRALALFLSLAFAASGAAAADVTVFAAASLKESLDEAVRRFDADAGHRTRVSYGASSALARQIERGAPADLFLSADVEWMDYLAARKLIDARSRIELLSNRLVLISPAGSDIEVAIRPDFPLGGLLGTNRLAMADPDHVPAGKYARSALETLGAWKGVSGKIARTENVRAALALVARRETPLGIVYRTDALAERKVRIVGEFPVSSHPRIVYPAALSASSRSPAAVQLLAFLQSQIARAIWEKHGFTALH
jgi:molybdate transport system substrate-binding protein